MEPDHRSTNSSEEPFCPQCGCGNLVQGPEEKGWFFRTSYVARCLGCGHRLEVSREEWRTLPLPEVGDAFETWDDKMHLTRRAPMSAGQIVLVLLGIVGFFVVAFLVPDEGDVDLALIAFMPVVFGCWWLGRLLFPPKRTIP